MSQSDIDSLIEEFSKAEKGSIEDIIDEFAQESSKEEMSRKDGKENEQTSLKDDSNGSGQEQIKGVRLPENEHRVIDKLDEINKESEEKVNKLFEYLETITDELDKTEKLIKEIKPYMEKHKEFMDFFVEHFPKTVVKNNYEYFKNIIDITKDIENSVSVIRNNVFDAMDTLQFQDITRQKIERVISVIKALHDYLNMWFDSSYDDKPRARVAHTIVDEKEKDKIDQDVEDIIKQMQEKGEI